MINKLIIIVLMFCSFMNTYSFENGVLELDIIALKKILPYSSREEIDLEMKEKILNYVFENLTIEYLKEKNEYDVLFRLLNISDGYQTEILTIELGLELEKNPELFFNDLENNMSALLNLDSILANLGENYVDEFELQKMELERRLKIIKTTKNIDPLLRRVFINELNYLIKIRENWIEDI